MNKTTFEGVSVLTIGPAKGHRLQIDRTSLEGVLALIQGRTLKAYVSHDNATGDRLGEEVGTFSNFRMEGDRIRADFAFLESFVKHSPQIHQTLVELAERDAESFGVSLTGITSRSWATDDGREILAEGEWEGKRPANAVFDFPSARFREVRSADFVSSPAANVGLFSALERRLEERSGEIAALTKERDGLLFELSRLRNSAEEINLLRDKVTALAARLVQAERFDMRKAGAPAMPMDPSPTGLASDPGPPSESATDMQKWEHYAALEKISPGRAEAYRRKHMFQLSHGR